MLKKKITNLNSILKNNSLQLISQVKKIKMNKKLRLRKKRNQKTRIMIMIKSKKQRTRKMTVVISFYLRQYNLIFMMMDQFCSQYSEMETRNKENPKNMFLFSEWYLVKNLFKKKNLKSSLIGKILKSCKEI
jgi:hypothetical protein